ncbi:hypothetical protein PENSPDRAFT_653443 [Peniophora sp. CONT]|nr:hypothetical protein PENSPDRAFT_653443 [Peniophora sp. CONT]
MLAYDGLPPILMDFGSCIRVRVSIVVRARTLAQQDLTEEHSPMAYRVPQLFDVNTGVTLDGRVGI